ncbi:MAG: glycerol-3-phosphate 1-O-acyltransferase PlsY [Oceanococcaceae bacterium]
MNLISLICLLLAFLLGSLLGGQLLGRLRGLDLRQSGSGNIGATNALRAGGKVFALGVLLWDAGKGILAVWLPSLIAPTDTALPWLCGLAAVAGHVYSPFARFSGGKGAATALGAAAVLLPLGFAWALGAFVFCLLLCGYVSLSMLFALAILALHTACFSVWSAWSLPTAYALCLFFFLCWTHRENLQRLRAGTENRFEKVMLRRPH